MDLKIKPYEINKHTNVTITNIHFESKKEIKTSKFFEITLTHIQTGISYISSGYNELEVMKTCLEKLNDLIIVHNFNNQIEESHMTYNTKEVNINGEVK